MLLELGPRSKNNKLVIAEYYVFGDRGVSSHCQISQYIIGIFFFKHLLVIVDKNDEKCKYFECIHEEWINLLDF